MREILITTMQRGSCSFIRNRLILHDLLFHVPRLLRDVCLHVFSGSTNEYYKGMNCRTLKSGLNFEIATSTKVAASMIPMPFCGPMLRPTPEAG